VGTATLIPAPAFTDHSASPAQLCGASLGQLQPVNLAFDPAQGAPRLLLMNDMTWNRKHLGLGVVTESRLGSGRVWKLDPTTLNPTWSSMAFGD
jgi:hypothetical protein